MNLSLLKINWLNTMKNILKMKYIFIALFVLFNLNSFAQKITTQPATFTADEEVKIIVDVTGTPLAGIEPLYIWTWDPNEPPVAGGNGQWNNSNEAMKMTKEGPNIWSWTIVPATFYQKDIAQVTKIQFLVKAKDGTGGKQTGDLALTPDPLVYIPQQFYTFPSKVSQNDVVTVYFDQKLATSTEVQRMKDIKVSITLFDENGTEIAKTENPLPAKANGNSLYSFSFLPTRLLPASIGKKIASFTYQFSGSGKDATGADETIMTDEAEKEFIELK
jgi:hypothetical protein